MKRLLAAMILLPLTVSCGLSVDQVIGAVVSRGQIPPRIFLLCSPVFRTVDIATIVVGINAGIDENITKTAAIATADITCSDTAAQLLTIATKPPMSTDAPMDPGVDPPADTQSAPLIDFNALDAAVYETNCRNCYTAIIDSLYDN